MARQAALPVARPRSIPAPAWLTALYTRAGSRFALKPHPASGPYVLLPVPGLIGGAVLTLWLLLVALFSAIASNPFIYFQF